MKFLDTTTLQQISFADRPPSEYAFLSYTWSHSSEELSHDDAYHIYCGSLTDNSWSGRHTAAYRRVVQACQRARAHEIQYLWVDYLCVDQSSLADVAESVTGSFRLVWDAALCIVHLSDLAPPPSEGDSLAALERALSSCRWFTRAWTLQELIAARRAEFFDRDWNLRGAKTSMLPEQWLAMLSRVSGVDAPVLADRETLFDFSLGRRLSWACHRQTGRPEDGAYALMGICGIAGHLSPRYGEGQRRAFRRLQEKILKVSDDLSLLAWKRRQDDDECAGGSRRQQHPQLPLGSILADSVADFEHFASNSAWSAPFKSNYEITPSNRGWHIQALLCTRSKRSRAGPEVILILNASWRGRGDPMHVGILLREIEPELFVRSKPGEVECFLPRKGEVSPARICISRDVDKVARRMYAELKESRVSAWVDEASKRELPPCELQRVMSGSCSNRIGPTDENFMSIQSGEMQRQIPSSHETTMGDAAMENTRHSDPVVGEQEKRPSKRGVDDMLESEYEKSDSDCENDVLLFDSLPEKLELLEDSHPFQAVLSNLVSLGLSAWNDEKAATAAADVVEESQKPAATPPTPRKITTSRLTIGPLSIPVRQYKRARINYDHQENYCGSDSTGSYTAETVSNEPGMLMINSKLKTAHSSLSPSDLLACPFYRLEPAHHHSCMWELELRDTRTIIQHVIVDHRQRDHCPICYAVFASAADRDQHIITRSCNKRAAPQGLHLGVTEDQVEKLSRIPSRRDRTRPEGGEGAARSRGRAARGKATKHTEKQTPAIREEERWYAIWGILFPSVSPPSLAYLTEPGEREAVALRCFWRRAGPELVAGVLEERQLLRWEDPREEAALSALHASVLKGMVEEIGFTI